MKKGSGKRKTAVEARPTCGCGCGGAIRPGRRFLQGHDMKLKAALRKAAAAGGRPARGPRTGPRA